MIAVVQLLLPCVKLLITCYSLKMLHCYLEIKNLFTVTNCVWLFVR